MQQEGDRLPREQERARKEARRREQEQQRERQKQYELGRLAEAEAKTSATDKRINELDNILRSQLDAKPAFTLEWLKQSVSVASFSGGQLAVAAPPPRWEDYDARPPSALGRLFGGQSRYEQRRATAWQIFLQLQAEHALAEQLRTQQLAEAEKRHGYLAIAAQLRAIAHNKEVEELHVRVINADPDAIVDCFDWALSYSVYPSGFPGRYKFAFQPEARRLIVDYELPDRDVVPNERAYRYVKTRDAITSIPRPTPEIRDGYALVISQVALRTIREIFQVDEASEIVDTVVFNGHVSTKDRATGQAVRPCIISLSAIRNRFNSLVLTDVDPRQCLKYLNALVSPHPYDLEAVKPVVEFDLSRYRFVDALDAAASLDSRPDLLQMKPVEFEHLVRQLFEAMGMDSWVTQASRDDGVDAVAVNPDPIVGGLCVIQAKRYSGLVGVEAVRALAGVMDDKRATKGIMVTTSWFGKTSQDFVSRHGRIELIEGGELKYLLKAHLDRDVLVNLRQQPRADA